MLDSVPFLFLCKFMYFCFMHLWLCILHCVICTAYWYAMWKLCNCEVKLESVESQLTRVSLPLALVVFVWFSLQRNIVLEFSVCNNPEF